jgi:hypothetical protein
MRRPISGVILHSYQNTYKCHSIVTWQLNRSLQNTSMLDLPLKMATLQEVDLSNLLCSILWYRGTITESGTLSSSPSKIKTKYLTAGKKCLASWGNWDCPGELSEGNCPRIKIDYAFIPF